MMPIGSFRARIQHTSPGRVDQIIAGATSAETVNRAEDQMHGHPAPAPPHPGGRNDDFDIQTQAELQETIGGMLDDLSILLMAVAAISLLVGGIGVMNIMLVSVAERTREIGIRMSIGARERDILVQFLVEAVVLSLVGGFLGMALGCGGDARARPGARLAACTRRARAIVARRRRRAGPSGSSSASSRRGARRSSTRSPRCGWSEVKRRPRRHPPRPPRDRAQPASRLAHRPRHPHRRRGGRHRHRARRGRARRDGRRRSSRSGRTSSSSSRRAPPVSGGARRAGERQAPDRGGRRAIVREATSVEVGRARSSASGRRSSTATRTGPPTSSARRPPYLDVRNWPVERGGDVDGARRGHEGQGLRPRRDGRAQPLRPADPVGPDHPHRALPVPGRGRARVEGRGALRRRSGRRAS